jgi:hypothetical protein
MLSTLTGGAVAADSEPAPAKEPAKEPAQQPAQPAQPAQQPADAQPQRNGDRSTARR